MLFTYLLLFRRNQTRKPNLTSLQLQDFTLDELRLYDGNGPEGRILVAVNGKVFDVTNNGQQFYGKSTPIFWKDISRALACFDAELPEKDCGYDDLSDLSQSEMDRLLEWELQFLG
ncbi:unnamed protein product [Dicrocoelium dendriticum]|nr:unnamed protein product [Dicrocoelium dendriticum]